MIHKIRPARSEQDLEAARRLFRAYASSLGFDLCYQGFEEELAALPGKYAPPEGEILLAFAGDQRAVGCVALRPLSSEGVCEMKRLYVAPEGRGFGLGRTLVRQILAVGFRLGYREMWLDTLPTLAAAVALYEQEGFIPIPPYNETPIEETVFMGRKLTPNGAAQ